MAEAEAGEAEAEPPVEFLAMEDAPDPEDLPPASCVVFARDKQIRGPFVQPRKAPRRRCPIPDPAVLRDNVNMILLFDGVDGDAVQRVHKAWCSGDMSLCEFRRFSAAADEPFSFTVISLTERPFDGKYRQGFETFYTPERYLRNVS